jgi:hypothetical protein
MSGVASCITLGSIPDFAARSAWSGEVQRQAISRSSTFEALIWSSGEYFAAA